MKPSERSRVCVRTETMHTDAHRFYAVLGVDPAASEEDIRGAFRRRAKELHPDSPSGSASSFILLKRAYDTLIDGDRRTAYDRACQPPPRKPPSEPFRPQTFRTMPPLRPPTDTTRRGGVSFVRYAIAFLIMAAISLGGVQAMISLTEAPPSIQTRAVARVDAGTPPAPGAAAAEQSTAPGSSKTGFWDATPATPEKKTP